jgi:hypothetical protein
MSVMIGHMIYLAIAERPRKNINLFLHNAIRLEDGAWKKIRFGGSACATQLLHTFSYGAKLG